MLIDLLETNFKDISAKGFNDFVENYDGSPVDNHYVVFSNSKDLVFNKDNKAPFPNAMVAYPVKYVINNKQEFIHKSSKFINIIELRGEGVSIQHVNDYTIQFYMEKLKFTPTTIDDLLNDIKIKFSRSPSKHLMKFLIQKHNKTLKVPYVEDNARTRNRAILNKDHPSIVYITKPYAFRQITYYHNREISPEKIASTDLRKLAAFIAEAMDKTLSSDDEVSMFADTLFWTNDGVEIKLTRMFSNTSGNTFDESYYIVEIDTPNGIMLYTTEPEDTFANIKSNIYKRYARLNTPNDSWEPKSRDMFLSGIRKEFKMYDMEKERYTKTVDEYYPLMRDKALRFGIQLPRIHKFAPLDKIMIYLFMERFLRQQKNPSLAFEKLTEREGFTVRHLLGREPSKRIDIDLLSDIVAIYSKMKKISPSKNGWHIFDKQ